MNLLRQKLAKGKVLGCIQVMASADVTEVLAAAGVDMLMIDHEHGHGGLADVIAQLRALNGSGVPVLVRVPSDDAAYVHRLQDAGVDSILFPGVESADRARVLVRTCRYPPAGNRGAGGGLRASRYDRDAEYYRRANEDMLVAVQIESVAGVAAAAEICAVEGVDLVVLGPRDMSSSLGKLGRFDDADVRQLFEDAERLVLASGIAMGSTVFPGLTIGDMFARGHRLLLAGTDVGWLAKAAKAAIEMPR